MDEHSRSYTEETLQSLYSNNKLTENGQQESSSFSRRDEAHSEQLLPKDKIHSIMKSDSSEIVNLSHHRSTDHNIDIISDLDNASSRILSNSEPSLDDTGGQLPRSIHSDEGLDDVVVKERDCRVAEDNDSGIDAGQRPLDTSAEPASDSVDSISKPMDEITSFVLNCWKNGDIKIDLARKNLLEIPSTLLQLTRLEYLYLEGNKISSLPVNFFSCLPSLKWLDLRRNKLSTLSCPSLSDHRCLQTLLLEGNQLKSLPLQLGMVPSLVSLNIRGNPVEFPPPEILEQGVRRICQYLQDLFIAKSEGRDEDIDRLLLGLTVSQSQQSQQGIVSDDRCKHTGIGGVTSSGTALKANESNKQCQASGSSKTASKKTGRKISHRSSVQLSEKNTRSAVTCTTQSEKYLDPSREAPLPTDVIEAKAISEYHLYKKKCENVKIEETLQRVKNQETTKTFRDETKRLQQKKLMERRIRGKIDFEQPATKAPFAIETGSLRLPTNEERLAYDPRQENQKPRPMSPASVLRNEELRVLKEKALEAKIREHTKAMRERRLKPRGDPKQELEAARREIEFAMSLKAELQHVMHENIPL